jgi:hypothetical protein
LIVWWFRVAFGEETFKRALKAKLVEALREELTSGDGNVRILLAQLLRRTLGVVTVFIDNGLNQAVNVQIVGCRDRGCSDSVDVGSVIVVPAGSKDARTLTPETSGWLPFITVRVWCTTAPATGAVSVWLVRSAEDQVEIVKALEVRDTAVHSFASDPGKVFVREW